jgi:hypothetical protein
MDHADRHLRRARRWRQDLLLRLIPVSSLPDSTL